MKRNERSCRRSLTASLSSWKRLPPPIITKIKLASLRSRSGAEQGLEFVRPAQISRMAEDEFTQVHKELKRRAATLQRGHRATAV